MNKDKHKPRYWKRLWAALWGRSPFLGADSSGNEAVAELASRIAALEMDLRERDERIKRMESEYAVLQATKEQVTVSAGQDHLEALFKKLAGPLSNLLALTTMAEAGQEVQAADLVQLIKTLAKELARAGLEPIGTAGEQATFDVTLHQRMSGGSVHSGTPVVVRIGGFRVGQRVLMKAMVTAKEEQHGQGGD